MNKSFSIPEGTVLAKRYTVLTELGRGWEGEVYLVREKGTGAERSIKLFYPVRNKRNETLRRYARKLHKLRNCHILIQYHTQDEYEWKGEMVRGLVSEFASGDILSEYIKKKPGKKLHPYEALHFLYALVKGLEEIHRHGEYHGDLHEGNIIVTKSGLEYTLKLFDLYHWRDHTKPENQLDDVVEAIKITYRLLGGSKTYEKLPQAMKDILLAGRKPSIKKKFRSAVKLREHIETMEW